MTFLLVVLPFFGEDIIETLDWQYRRNLRKGHYFFCYGFICDCSFCLFVHFDIISGIQFLLLSGAGSFTEENVILMIKRKFKKKMLLELLERELGSRVPFHEGAMAILYNNFDQIPGDGKPVQLYALALPVYEIPSHEQ